MAIQNGIRELRVLRAKKLDQWRVVKLILILNLKWLNWNTAIVPTILTVERKQMWLRISVITIVSVP